MDAALAVAADTATRCGIDSVEIARVDRLLRESSPEDLARLFTPRELADAGDGPGRSASLAARVAAKEACLKLFPRETALGEIEPADFGVERDAYGAPQAVIGERAAPVLARNRIRAIALSLTHDRVSASAVALALPETAEAPLAGRIIDRLLPIRRRVIVENLRRVFGALPDAEITCMVQAQYAHLWQLVGEFVSFRWLSDERKAAIVRVENHGALARALDRGKGALVLTGHFGNWEVATVAGLTQFPYMRGRFHFLRRPIKPRWLDRLVGWRFQRAGFGLLSKRGSLDTILSKLEAGDVIVFTFDQHAGPPDGIQVDFFGHPAWTFRSLAVLALATGAPVVPASSWREPDRKHVLRFEEAIATVECESAGEEIRRNTREYNATLERLILRHPEQWYWVHRRWKELRRK